MALGAPAEGERVIFIEAVERYPHFTIPAGTTGEVVYMDDRTVTVATDQFIPGLSDDSSWEGFDWYFEDWASGATCPFVNLDAFNAAHRALARRAKSKR